MNKKVKPLSEAQLDKLAKTRLPKRELLNKPKRAKRPEPRKVDILSAIEEAWSEIESLKMEMEDWQGNLEGANMDHLDKYSDVEECASSLDQLEEPSLGDIAGLRSHMMVIHDPTPRKRGYSRPERMSQALAILSDANAELETLRENIEKVFAEVEEIVSNGESISFPGMF